MGKKAKSNAGKKKAQDRKIDKSTLPPPPPRPEDEVCIVDVFLLQVFVDGLMLYWYSICKLLQFHLFRILIILILLII